MPLTVDSSKSNIMACTVYIPMTYLRIEGIDVYVHA